MNYFFLRIFRFAAATAFFQARFALAAALASARFADLKLLFLAAMLKRFFPLDRFTFFFLRAIYAAFLIA